MLADSLTHKFDIHLERVLYSTYDSLMNFGFKTLSGQFYQTRKVVDRPQHEVVEPNLLMQTNLYLTHYEIKNLRIIYGLSDLLSDLGGVMNVILAVFGVVFRPMSKHMYYTNAIKRLFLARTRDPNLLLDQKLDEDGKEQSNQETKITKYLNEKNFPCDYDDVMRRELQKHRLIRLSLRDHILLFIHNNLGAVICQKVCLWKKKDKLQKLYSQGQKRIEKDLNLVKLVRNLKRIQILMKNSLMTK